MTNPCAKPIANRLLGVVGLLVTATVQFALAHAAIDEEAPWPRVRSTNGNTLTLHVPQVERWTSNWFSARAALELKMTHPKANLLGVVWFEAHGSVDHSNRLVTLDRIEITKARFPDARDNGSNALATLRQLVTSGARTVSLDYLVTTLGFEQAAARQGAGGFENSPPNIIWATNRTVLILADGQPILRPIPDSNLQRVLNTPALIVKEASHGIFYLWGEGQWFAADSIEGQWVVAHTPPAEVAALHPGPAEISAVPGEFELPRIIVSTRPAELLTTHGFPDFRPIRDTALQYAADSDNQLFFYNPDREAYLLLSGRWFKAKSLRGPWTHVTPRDLPADFARIPPGSPQAVVLASVPGTPQADLAVLATSIPTTATVNRHETKLELSYDGEPQFRPIEGTDMSYACNAPLPVIQVDGSYYALDDAVWFLAASPLGPWQVATEIPEEIYKIPPNSPVYYATFARVYDATDEEVDVGYTPGYVGAYEEDGTVVYGTGWPYEPWYGNDYYGWGWTWGYGYVYVPWYQWWVWRPWWNQPGGLRAAIIENIYDRWQDRSRVTHYNSSAPSASRAPSAPRAPQAASALGVPPGRPSSYPALYGRFRGTTRPAELSPPSNTLLLNPYLRPQSSIKPGEIPRGAQLLSTVRAAPGGGRDLYASPDGVVYRRKNDGWYRREAGGGWSFFAPTPGRIERETVSRRENQGSGPGGIYRPGSVTGIAPSRAQPRRDLVPDSADRLRAEEVASLERQYYARALAQIRTQNWRASANASRPTRTIGRRR